MKALLQILLLMATFAFVQASAAQSSKKTVVLRSVDGIQFNIEYSIRPTCTNGETSDGVMHLMRFASPVDISSPQLQRSDFVLIETEFWGQRHSSGNQPNPLIRLRQHYDRVVRLDPDLTGKLKGSFGSLVVRDEIPAIGESWIVFQTLRITVNGRPLIDPVSGTDRFQISLDDQQSCLTAR